MLTIEQIKQAQQDRINSILKSFDNTNYDLVESQVFNNLQKGLIDEETFFGAMDGLDIIKARHGVYKDNAQNKKLKRVGMPYGKRIEEHDHIGKTKSGKYFDIRREHGHEDYKDFTEEEHKDVAEKHKKILNSGKLNNEQHAYHGAMVAKHNNHSDLKVGDIYEHSGGKAKIEDIYTNEDGKKMVSYKHINEKGVHSNEEQTHEAFKKTIGNKINESSEPKKEGGVWTKEQKEKIKENDEAFKNHLKEKGIDPNSKEAGDEWHRSEHKKKQMEILGKKPKESDNKKEDKQEFSDLQDKLDYYKELSPKEKEKYEDELMNHFMKVKDMRNEHNKKVIDHQIAFTNKLFEEINKIKKESPKSDKNKESESILESSSKAFSEANNKRKVEMYESVLDKVKAIKKLGDENTPSYEAANKFLERHKSEYDKLK